MPHWMACLTGWLASLERFIARFADKLRPFFLALKGASATGWTEDCQTALAEIKHYLTRPPILSSPRPEEQLYIYLAISDYAVSAVLFHCPTEKE